MWRFLRQMSDALKYLHRQHPPVIHRDLKPDNIISKKDASGYVCFKIADFGIARVLGKNAFGEYYARSQIGTPIYMAPEVLRVRQLLKLMIYEIIWTDCTLFFRGLLMELLSICGPSVQ